MTKGGKVVPALSAGWGGAEAKSDRLYYPTGLRAKTQLSFRLPFSVSSSAIFVIHPDKSSISIASRESWFCVQSPVRRQVSSLLFIDRMLTLISTHSVMTEADFNVKLEDEKKPVLTGKKRGRPPKAKSDPDGETVEKRAKPVEWTKGM